MTIEWSSAMDDKIRTMRASGEPWSAVARAVGALAGRAISKPTARVRGTEVLHLPGATDQPQTEPYQPPPDPIDDFDGDGDSNDDAEPPDTLYSIAISLGRPDRADALPAGHPLSWGAMTAGTCLSGIGYGASC